MERRFRKRIRNLWRRQLLLPLVIVTFLTVLSVDIIVGTIHRHYIEEIKARIDDNIHKFEQGLLSSNLAAEAIDKVFEERLFVLGQTAIEQNNQGSEDLIALSRTFHIDEINIYNQAGIIVNSTNPALIGLIAPQDHAFHTLSNSSETHLTEKARPNISTGIRYKYGYFKTGSQIIQIGIRESKLLAAVSELSISKTIEQLASQPDVLSITYVADGSQGATYSSDTGERFGLLGRTGRLQGYEEFSITNVIPTYDVYKPITDGSEVLGTIYLSLDANPIYGEARYYTTVATVAALLIYLLCLVILFSSYSKTKTTVKNLFYDISTGLPNDCLLDEYIGTDKSNEEEALIVIGFNNLKSANIKYGTQISELITKHAAEILRSFESPSLRCFKVDNNHLGAYVKGVCRHEVTRLINRIELRFEIPLSIESDTCYLRPLFGCFIAKEKTPNQEAIRNAVMALTLLENNNSNDCSYSFYCNSMKETLKRESAIESELRDIISKQDTNRLYLYYQPQINLTSNSVYGFEALARMNSKTLGKVMPTEFINVAEKKGLVLPLGNFILRQACELIKTLSDKGKTDTKISVNVSILQVLDESFIPTLLDILAETESNPKMLEIEITETMISENYQLINKKINQLHSIGIDISLDDFGTGYSTFVRLNELKIKSLKIDQYFVKQISELPNSRHITDNIIDIAHKLGVTVVAEGVETNTQKEYLANARCDIGQGYLFSKPISAEKVLLFLEENELSNTIAV